MVKKELEKRRLGCIQIIINHVLSHTLMVSLRLCNWGIGQNHCRRNRTWFLSNPSFSAQCVGLALASPGTTIEPSFFVPPTPLCGKPCDAVESNQVQPSRDGIPNHVPNHLLTLRVRQIFRLGIARRAEVCDVLAQKRPLDGVLVCLLTTVVCGTLGLDVKCVAL